MHAFIDAVFCLVELTNFARFNASNPRAWRARIVSVRARISGSARACKSLKYARARVNGTRACVDRCAREMLLCVGDVDLCVAAHIWAG